MSHAIDEKLPLSAITYTIHLDEDGDVYYTNDNPWSYFSPRYKLPICIPKDMPSDGATQAPDIASRAWWVHDRLCLLGHFDDPAKTPCTNWQASQVLQDILWEEAKAHFNDHSWIDGVASMVRSRTWFWATWLGGGGAARANGMI